jgi:hypothetical protein
MATVQQLSDWDLIRKAYGLGTVKQAFVDPASMGAPPIGGMPQGAPIPMDPAAMGGGMPPMDPAAMGGGMPPMDPAAMGGGMPPMDPAAMGGEMPADPSTAAMGEQEALRSIVREEIQKAMGGGTGDAGQGLAAAPKKGGNKFDEAISQLKQEMQQQMKVFVTAMRKAGIEIPLADLFSLDGSLTPDAPLGQPSPVGGKGISEELQPGTSGTAEGGGVGKIAAFERDVDMLQKLAGAKDALNRSVLGKKITKFDPRGADLSYLNGLFS